MVLLFAERCYLGSHCNLHVLGLGAFRTHAHVKRDRLTDLQHVKLTVASAEMEEHVIASVHRSDETESFLHLGLDRTCSHCGMVVRSKSRKQ